MTVIVGFCCDEGLVIASDSQMSAGPTKSWGQKVWTVDNPGLAFGLAGVESTMHLLRDYFLGASFDTSTVSSAQATVIQAATMVLKPEYDRVRSLLPQAGLEQLPIGEALVGIYVHDTPHLFQLMATGQVIDHHERAFAAIGIGRFFAEHAVTVFEALQQGMTLHQAKMLAFRVVQAAIAAAGPAIPVGGQVQMATVGKSNGGIQCELLPWDDPEMKDAVDGWLGAEAMRFRQHVPPGDAAEEETCPQ